VREALDIYSKDKSEVLQRVLIEQAKKIRKYSDHKQTPGGPIT